jgi:hypothetical protein
LVYQREKKAEIVTDSIEKFSRGFVSLEEIETDLISNSNGSRI